MFTQLNQILLQSRYVSRDYWHDCALLEAADCLSRFESRDWQALAENLPTRPNFWRLGLIAVLLQPPTLQGIHLLGRLRHDSAPPVAREARRVILKLAREYSQDSTYALPLQQLAAEITAEKKPFRLFRFLQKTAG